jgi:hypothetical protein
MAFTHGKGAAVLVDEFDLSAFLNTFDGSATADTAEVTTFGNSSKAYVAGTKDATISLGGFFDGAANAVDEVLQAALGGSAIITLAPAGVATIGNRCSLADCITTSYSVAASVGDAVTVSAEGQVTGGLLPGVVLASLIARTATGQTAAVDNGASTAGGAKAFLHVTAFTGTDVTIKVQESPDNSTWADMITFTQATGVTSESGTASGTIDQYLRVDISGTFTSVTFAVALARL